LLDIFKESQVALPHGAVSRPHVKLEVPKDGIDIFARLINKWINLNGEIPTWEDLSGQKWAKP
jgi:hypothetical protein